MNKKVEARDLRDLAYYCGCFVKLNVSKTKERGTANHKPILILSVLELITQQSIVENQIFVSNELIETFKKYWSILVADSIYTDALHYPFFHLRRDSFWHLKFRDTYKEGERIKTTNKLKEKVECAYLDRELFELVQDASSRQILVDSLVSTWFTDSRSNLGNILDIDLKFDQVDRYELQNIDSEIKITLRKSIVRNSFFRKLVVREYNYRCAFCKLRIVRDPNQNIVDGAHIKPFSEFLDSKIDNGLSLCKNHHWAFDLGWFSIDNNYRILIAQGLDDDSPYTRAMKEFERELIALPSNERYFPRLESLKWHRENKFKS
jgi:putative restriction endonuclease